MKPAPTPGSRVITSGLVVLAVVAATVTAIRLTRPRESVAVLGDSMVALAKTQLVDAGHDEGYGMSVDGIAGIPLSARMDAIAELSGHRAGPVVIELGTNDVLMGAAPDELAARIDQAAAKLTTDPCVVFVAVGILYDVDGRGQGFNDHLRAVAAAHSNMHVFAWDTEYHQHPDWSSDTVHLRPEYLARYAQGIVDAVHDDC